jgi:hypothetical protein
MAATSEGLCSAGTGMVGNPGGEPRRRAMGVASRRGPRPSMNGGLPPVRSLRGAVRPGGGGPMAVGDARPACRDPAAHRGAAVKAKWVAPAARPAPGVTAARLGAPAARAAPGAAAAAGAALGATAAAGSAPGGRRPASMEQQVGVGADPTMGSVADARQRTARARQPRWRSSASRRDEAAGREGGGEGGGRRREAAGGWPAAAGGWREGKPSWRRRLWGGKPLAAGGWEKKRNET